MTGQILACTTNNFYPSACYIRSYVWKTRLAFTKSLQNCHIQENVVENLTHAIILNFSWETNQ